MRLVHGRSPCAYSIGFVHELNSWVSSMGLIHVLNTWAEPMALYLGSTTHLLLVCVYLSFLECSSAASFSFTMAIFYHCTTPSHLWSITHLLLVYVYRSFLECANALPFSFAMAVFHHCTTSQYLRITPQPLLISSTIAQLHIIFRKHNTSPSSICLSYLPRMLQRDIWSSVFGRWSLVLWPLVRGLWSMLLLSFTLNLRSIGRW